MTVYIPRSATVLLDITGSCTEGTVPFGPDHIHISPSPPVSSNSISWPTQTSRSAAVAVALGAGLSFTVISSVAVQPSPSVTVTLKRPKSGEVDGDIIGLLFPLSLKPLGPVQSQSTLSESVSNSSISSPRQTGLTGAVSVTSAVPAISISTSTQTSKSIVTKPSLTTVSGLVQFC